MVFHCFNLTQLISEPWIQHEISRDLEISFEMLEKWTSPELILASHVSVVLGPDKSWKDAQQLCRCTDC